MNAIISRGDKTAHVQLPVGRKQLSGALSYGEGARLYNLKEVADFIHIMGGGYITEDDGTPLLEIKERDSEIVNQIFLRFSSDAPQEQRSS